MTPRSSSQDQLSLFGDVGDVGDLEARPGRGRRGGVEAALPSEEIRELAERLPSGIYMGGSTWSFPGWAGLVYGREHSEAELAKAGLAAYARYPLFRAAGIDRTFYRPVPAETFARYAADVPEDFRFLVKAHEAITVPQLPDHPRYGTDRGQKNRLFLDAAYTADQVVAPFVAGLGEKAGALLFQFGPQPMGTGAQFAERLLRFLAALPRGPVYAVELRQRDHLTPDYAQALAATRACHCLNVHPRMPDIRTQARLTAVENGRVRIVRWLLGEGLSYEEAGRRYAPFNRLVAPDLRAREAVAELAREALAEGQPFLATINNNAEGSAPLSAAELAREILDGGQAAVP
jgi:uncharacterized protein YecE (DUF72 family)